MPELGLISKTIKGSDLVLRNLGNKVAEGQELSNPERVMAISNAAKESAGKFGPTVEEFQVGSSPLPEETRGVLADFAS